MTIPLPKPPEWWNYRCALPYHISVSYWIPNHRNRATHLLHIYEIWLYLQKQKTDVQWKNIETEGYINKNITTCNTFPSSYSMVTITGPASNRIVGDSTRGIELLLSFCVHRPFNENRKTCMSPVSAEFHLFRKFLISTMYIGYDLP